MKQMQGLDASFVALEQPNAPLHVGSILIYDPTTAPNSFVRFKDILRFIENRLHLADTMRQKMVEVPFGIDYPYWINDSKFDLEYHVRHLALPKPGDWRQLCILSSRIFARPLDLSRPPWEITVVEGLDNVAGVPKGSFAFLTKVHHSAIDGVSGVDIMNAIHTLTPEVVGEEDSEDKWRPEADPSQMGMFMRGCINSLANPVRQARAWQKAAPGMLRASEGLMKRKYDFKAILQTPKTRFNGTVSPHRMYDACEFKLADVQKIRKLCSGATLNDVMLSVVGGGMRIYLDAKDELPETSLTAMAPISVRTESEKNTMGNQVSAMFVPLGSHIGSARSRLRYVHEESSKSKSLTQALGARQMNEMAKLSPAPLMNMGAKIFHRLKLADYLKPFVNTIVTNVPGPPVPIYSAGARLVGMYGKLCLVDGVRLGHVVHSYVDKINIGFTADREVLNDPDFYAECINKSFAEHLAAFSKLKQKTKKDKDRSTQQKSTSKTKKKSTRKKNISKTSAQKKKSKKKKIIKRKQS